MKKDDDNKDLDSKLQGKVFTATNPFLIAFRENKDLASFLDDREKVEGEDVKSSDEDVIKPVSDENGSIISEEQVEIPQVA
ncbi:putative translation elongation factor EFTs/EF1B [Helianthus annuus]|nr:putative translation elongation factor EFTs/EF1B [Helianthus annuus]